MGATFRKLARTPYFVVAASLVLSFLVPAFAIRASAAQITSRSIQMSNATQGATNTSYKVSFTPGQNASVQAIIVDFCDNDPLVSDTTCTLPTGFSITSSPAVTAQSSGAGCVLTTFTTAAQLNSNRTLELSAASPVSLTTSGACSFTLTTATNPTTANHTFYARIYTFDTKTHADAYSTSGPGVIAGVVDDGGIALSTTALIQITANVMEQLTFCVTSWNGLSGSNCSNASVGSNPPTITIGHGSPTKIIDSSAVDATSVYTQLSTNANGGVAVRMKDTYSSATCGGLSQNSGSTCPIPAAGASPVLLVAGTAKFGLCVVTAAGATADSPYNGSSPGTVACADTPNPSVNTSYGLDETNAIGTFGSQIFHTTGAVNGVTDILNFAATAANTTPAGVYQASESLIATGTF